MKRKELCEAQNARRLEENTIYEIKNPFIKSFLAGSISGTFSTVILQPLDLIKTRIQSSREGHYKPKILLVIGNVYHTGGILGFWKGVTPSLARTVPGVGLYFCGLYNLQEKLEWSNPSPLQAIILGITSRSFAGVVLLPFTVIKTRFESTSYQYRSVTSAFGNIYKNEGYKGLFSGLSATLLRDAPFSGLYFMLYSQSKKYLPEDKVIDSVPALLVPSINFCRGIIAGLLASVITQPADTAKTHMQLNPAKYNSLYQTVQCILETEGIQGLFRGMLPRCLRRTLMSALSWTVFEEVILKLGLK